MANVTGHAMDLIKNETAALSESNASKSTSPAIIEAAGSHIATIDIGVDTATVAGIHARKVRLQHQLQNVERQVGHCLCRGLPCGNGPLQMKFAADT